MKKKKEERGGGGRRMSPAVHHSRKALYLPSKGLRRREQDQQDQQQHQQQQQQQKKQIILPSDPEDKEDSPPPPPPKKKKKRRVRIIYDSSEDDDEVEIIEKSPSPLSILMEAPSLPHPSTSKQSGNKVIDDFNTCMIYDGQIISQDWVREDLKKLNEELKNHDGTANSSSSSSMGEIMEMSNVPPSPPALRPDPPPVPHPSTSKPTRKKDVEIVIPDDEYDNIIANLDLDAFIWQYG